MTFTAIEHIYETYVSKKMSVHDNSALSSLSRFIDKVDTTWHTDLMLAVGLHDIGKRVDLNGQHHAIVGYNLIKDSVNPLVSYLVLTHTDTELLIDIEEFELAEKRALSYFDELDRGTLLKLKAAVALSDLTASHLGGVIPYTERRKSISERYSLNIAAQLDPIFENAINLLNLNRSCYF